MCPPQAGATVAYICSLLEHVIHLYIHTFICMCNKTYFQREREREREREKPQVEAGRAEAEREREGSGVQGRAHYYGGGLSGDVG